MLIKNNFPFNLYFLILTNIEKLGLQKKKKKD